MVDGSNLVLLKVQQPCSVHHQASFDGITIIIWQCALVSTNVLQLHIATLVMYSNIMP